MIARPPFRVSVRVEMHPSGGYTRVVLFDITNGDIRQDILTEMIPLHLRPIGSKFVVILPRFQPEPADSVEDIRKMCRQVQVEELNDSP